MTLTPQQIEEYTAQAQALKVKLRSDAEDIKDIRTQAVATQRDPSSVHLILARIDRAKELSSDFFSAWDRIVLIDAKRNQTEFPNTQERSLKKQLLDDLDALRAMEIQLKTEPPCTTIQNTTLPAHDASSWSRQFLDRLNLPNFAGDVKTWVSFRDIFSSLVHDDTTIPPVAKLHLLISSLSGEARSIISGFDISDASYPLAWAALTKHYNNVRVLASTFLDNILKFRLPTNPNIQDLQDFNTIVADSISAFKALQLSNPEDKILSLLVMKTLDQHSRRRFELQQVENEFPTLQSIIEFVRNQCLALKLSGEADRDAKSYQQPKRSVISPSRNAFPARSSKKYNTGSSFQAHHAAQHCSFAKRTPSPKRRTDELNRRQNDSHRNAKSARAPSPKDRSREPRRSQHTGTPSQAVCPYCRLTHVLYRCPAFMGLTSKDRWDFASKWQGCHNCLNPHHKTPECGSKFRCRICNEPHHSLLHVASNTQVNPVCAHSESSTEHQTHVILGTARAICRDSSGRNHHLRLLLDCGSQHSYVSRSCAERLQLKIKPGKTSVSGLGGNPIASTLGVTKFTISPTRGTSRLTMTASVIENVTSHIPQQPIPKEIYEKFRALDLADPRFHQPQDIDVLLGADHFDQVVTGTFHKPDPEAPSMLPTIFGMVIIGSYKLSPSLSSVSFLCQDSHSISSQLQAFWELEETKAATRESPDDAFCEKQFQETHSRDASGRYMVRLPLTNDHDSLGENRSVAKRRFLSLESKLASNEHLGTEYRMFMQEYEDLNHMSIAPNPSAYVIPHFGIMQQKLRVVFDASCPSTNMSLNDVLLSGPKLQTDICDVLMHFRLFPIAITTDMVKMYRQILVHPEDRKYQHIFWRSSSASKLIEYELNTVTYGEAPSAFLAIRTVNQLLHDEGPNFPLATQRLKKAMFVDDICTGADDEAEATILCHQLIGLFASGCIPLSKWSSNSPSVLPKKCHTTTKPLIIQPDETSFTKVLGLIWNPTLDSFSYTVHQPPSSTPTKRSILSFIARMFDPLGFLAPVVFRAKTFIQELWKQQLGWDDEIPEVIAERWFNFSADWTALASVRIPRYLSSRNRVCNLVGFCDASNLGYAAVLYLQVLLSQNSASSFIIKAKTRVAPAKFVSIPRLELCGAHLLAKLANTINLDPDLRFNETYLFCDSTVALAWINTPSHLLKTFEANRVAAIDELVPRAKWKYVRTEENPADIASRGLNPPQMGNTDLWWIGPSWLKSPPSFWLQPEPNQSQEPDINPEITSSFHTARKSPVDSSWMQRFSRLQLLLRTVVRMLRFSRKLQPASCSMSAPITHSEILQAVQKCAISTQSHYFPSGINSPELASLSPFYDQAGILRVGGRLQNAPISFEKRHPIIIPRLSHLARLIVKDIHERYYHAGPTLTLAILRNDYWIPSSLRFVKSQIASCVTCFKRKPVPQSTLMAPLPTSRFSTGRAFLQTGIDFAGPFTLRDSLRRKPIFSKGYICLFVCLSTKALPLEAVSALTTEAFLATLDRFIARRGKPDAIHTDNATNFVGASRYLKDLAVFLQSHHDSITEHLATTGINWVFIPPRSPHFGGLWEAGVKSVKSLLVSSTGSQAFTYEELSTILSRIEGLLNSRPLCVLSENPDSLDALTPGHFLIGSSTHLIPEEPIEELPDNRLSRWQLVQKQVQHVWSRWRKDYLSTLQQRTKWRKSSPNLQVNDIVILLEKKSPPGHWPLARVIELHPGSDGKVRVVSVRTSSGSIFKRSINYLARLPIPNSNTPS